MSSVDKILDGRPELDEGEGIGREPTLAPITIPSQLTRALENVPPDGRMVILCAEAGMHKTALATKVMKSWQAAGLSCRYHSLLGISPALASRSLRLLARSFSTGEEDDARLLIVDDVPLADEPDLERLAGTLQALASDGRVVMVCLRPEAEQLVEELPGALCLRSHELLAYKVSDGELTWRQTHGIPALTEALADASGAVDDTGFLSALSHLVEAHLRPSLGTEELRLRLAMLLLGSGDSEELAAIVERMDVDALAWIHRDAPLFGIDPMAGSFACAGIDHDDAFAACVIALRPCCTREPQIVARCARMLMYRGNIRRAVQVCGLCLREDFVGIACEWGVELVCAGEDALVRRALSQRDAGGPQPEGAQASEIALSILSDPADTLNPAPLVDVARGASRVARARRRHLELLQACRDVDRGLDPRHIADERPGDDVLSRTFAAHLRARVLLIQGKASEAYELLINNAARLEPDTLPSALLCDDFELAEVLLGEEPTVAEGRAFARARQTICRMQCDRLSTYRVTLEPVLAVLAGRSAHAKLEAAIICSERMGDYAIRAALLLVAAIADNRSQAYPRAHVRARAVASLSRSGVLSHLAGAAELVDALVCVGLEDSAKLVDLARPDRHGAMRDLALLATVDLSGGENRKELTTLRRTHVPHNHFWLLNILCNDCGTASLSFRHNAPSLWQVQSRKAVRRAESLSRHEERMSSSPSYRERADQAEDDMVEPRSPIELSLLGGFRVMMGDTNVAGRLDRRHSKDLLALLGAVKGHKVSRFEIVDSIWPDHEEMKARQRVYEATSTIRGVLRMAPETTSVIVTSRSDSSLELNGSLVRCDVDEFERVAMRALNGEDNDESDVIRLACDASKLYVGDLYVSHHDARGIMAARRDELRELFMDAAVAGAGAALASEKLSLALRLARRAVEVDGMREDAVYLLVEVLKLSGRTLDAWDVYQSYAERLLAVANMPPSRSMRTLVSDIVPSRGRLPRQESESIGVEPLPHGRPQA